MSAPSLPWRLRDLPPGAVFVLKRTGARYRLLARDPATPSGTRFVVQRMGFARPATLHGACVVEVVS